MTRSSGTVHPSSQPQVAIPLATISKLQQNIHLATIAQERTTATSSGEKDILQQLTSDEIDSVSTLSPTPAAHHNRTSTQDGDRPRKENTQNIATHPTYLFCPSPKLASLNISLNSPPQSPNYFHPQCPSPSIFSIFPLSTNSPPLVSSPPPLSSPPISSHAQASSSLLISSPLSISSPPVSSPPHAYTPPPVSKQNKK